MNICLFLWKFFEIELEIINLYLFRLNFKRTVISKKTFLKFFENM